MDDVGRKVWGWGASFKVFNVIITRHGNPMCSDDTATAAFNPVYQAHLGLIMERMSKKKKKIIYNIANGHGWMAHENTNPTRLCGNIWRAGDTASNVVRNSFVTTRNWNVSFSNSSHGFSSASLPIPAPSHVDWSMCKNGKNSILRFFSKCNFTFLSTPTILTFGTCIQFDTAQYSPPLDDFPSLNLMNNFYVIVRSLFYLFNVFYW